MKTGGRTRQLCAPAAGAVGNEEGRECFRRLMARPAAATPELDCPVRSATPSEEMVPPAGFEPATP
jgi:hypothetical protein